MLFHMAKSKSWGKNIISILQDEGNDGKLMVEDNEKNGLWQNPFIYYEIKNIINFLLLLFLSLYTSWGLWGCGCHLV